MEIESKKDRLYEWVMHHMPAVLDVSEVDAAPYRKVLAADRMAPGCWRYDALARRLYIRVKARAGGDHIVNISLAESME